MRSCGDVGKHLKNGFGKKEEGGHELVEMLRAAVPLSGATVPHYLSSTTQVVSQVHDLNPFSYQDCSTGVFLHPIHTVSYLVSLQCIDGARR